MEASLRFAGPETMDTKIYGRLTAWQNWIFQRPNAVGREGALNQLRQANTSAHLITKELSHKRHKMFIELTRLNKNLL